MNKYDLLLTGGHLIDPSQKIDGIKNVGCKDGRVVEVSDKLDHALAEKVHNISDNIITPRLIDLHTHIYWGGTYIGIDPTDYARRCCTSTMIDATILSIEKGEFIFTDSLGHTRSGEKKFTLEGVVLNGEMWS